MLISQQILDELSERLAASAAPLPSATVTCALDPVSLVRAGASSFSTAAYFGLPGGTETAALGVAWRSTTAGADRLPRLVGDISTAGFDAGARLLVGFSFADDGPRVPQWDGFPSASAVLPMVVAVRDESGTRLSVTLPPGVEVEDALAGLRGLSPPGDPFVPEAANHVIAAQPSPSEWREEVAEAVAAIRAGAMKKVVLARQVEIRSEPIADPFGLVAQLCAAQPESFSYGWQEGPAVFLGASPELLIARSGHDVVSNPHAGSARRGATDDEDERLGRDLLDSVKDNNEHRLVVEDVVQRLQARIGEVHVSEPSLRKTSTVQHLATTVTGRLAGDQHVLELAGDLHPTPAVGGTPRAEALAFIDKAEGIDRGWYSGGIGWVSPSGDGEIAVAVRCGLLRGEQAYLYAGNGIVARSDPDEELAETRLKFRPLLNLLAAT